MRSTMNLKTHTILSNKIQAKNVDNYDLSKEIFNM
jgi:hypothetical protein